MKHIKTFNQVNEEASLFKKIRQGVVGYKKSDMYISEQFPKPTVAEITPDKIFSGKQVPDLDDEVLKGYVIKDVSRKGVFVEEEARWGSDYSFQPTFSSYNQVWFDQSYQFNKLKKMSDAMGYKIGKQVNIIDGGYGQISEIVKFAFYKLGTLDSCEEKLTLLYKVGEIYYQITQIELSKDKEVRSNIVDDVIKENFYDLLDDDVISYSSTSTNNVYECKIIVNNLDTLSILSRIAESLSVAQSRLRDSNILLNITNISKVQGDYTISFVCKPI